jgi:8-oxo-dGTP pyrophosphatase MutT (NUDIX family)
MARVITGDRIGKTGKIRLGCSVTIFDPTGTKIILTQRTDNFLWCLPGGAVDPGESVVEAAERETLEEVGIKVKVLRLIGVYSCPDRVIEYADGNRWQIIAMNFEAQFVEGKPCCTPEVKAYGYYDIEEIKGMDLMEHHWERIYDALEHKAQPFLR